jgi:methyl-accepting chemotaxis protein
MTLAENSFGVGQQLSKMPRNRSFNWFQERSLRTKAMLLGVALGVLPVVVVGIAATTIASRSMTDKIIQVEQSKALKVADSLNLFVRERYTDIQTIASIDILTTSAANTNVDAKSAALEQFLEVNSIYNNIAFVNLQGDVVAQTKGAPLGNLKDQVWFQEVLRTDKPYISQPAVASTNGEFSLFVAAPVKDRATRRTIGIVRTRMAVEQLSNLLDQGSISLDQFHLIDADGKVFVGPGDPKQYITNTSTVDKTRAENNQNAAGNGVDAQTLFPEYKRLKESGQVTSLFDSNQLLVYTPVKGIDSLPRLGWEIVAALDNSVVLAPQQQLLLSLLIGSVIVIVIASTIAALLASRAIRPLLVAADAVERIGQGELDVRLPDGGKDELATLSANINTMATRLQDSMRLQELEIAQERILTLAKGSDVVQSSDLSGMFDAVLSSVRALLNLDRIVVYVVNGGTTASGVVSEAMKAGIPSAVGLGVKDDCIPREVREAYRQGRMVVARDVHDAGFEQEHLKLLERLQVKASLILPIVNGEQLFGLLVAHHCTATYDWQEAEVSLLTRVATEMGLTVYRVELLEQTIRLAEEQRQRSERLQKRALELLQEVDPINQGDLTVRVRVTPDEIGTLADSYNEIVDNLRRIVTQVQSAANQVTTAASTNEGLILELAEESNRQTAEINTALAQVEQMADAIQEVARNAKAAETTVKRAAQAVVEGDKVMERTVEGIQTVQKTVAEAAQKVGRLGESSQKISTVVDLISAFAAQTNMLALNASIEASRAGAQGRGFAVVAEEVRALAQQSADATNEIKKLVAGIQAETSEVVQAMEAGTKQVDVGTKLVDETRVSLTQITTASTQIAQLVNAIAQSTVVQSRASETVSHTIKEVATIANQTSAEANQVALSVGELRQIAQSLKAGMEQFKLK